MHKGSLLGSGEEDGMRLVGVDHVLPWQLVGQEHE